MNPRLRHRRGGRVAIVSRVAATEKSRRNTAFGLDQIWAGGMKTKSSCEKGRNLGQPRVEAQVDGCLMTWEYSPISGKKALMLHILESAPRPSILTSVDRATTKSSLFESTTSGFPVRSDLNIYSGIYWGAMIKGFPNLDRY